MKSQPKVFTSTQAKKLLPKRKKSDNKTQGGKCLVVAGSKGMKGAAILTATAAARTGAGYVYLATENDILSPFNNPDFLEFPFNGNLNKIPFSAVALGPGLSSDKAVKAWIRKLQSHPEMKVVLDAQALNYLASQKPIKIPSHWIMTPHEGELARLLGISSAEVKKHRAKYALQAQKKWGCILLLKGHRTLIASADQFLSIPTGNPALAKAGTGDVLTGIIAGLLSQNLPSIDAACLGAYIHGKLADDYVLKMKKDALSLMASDLLSSLPFVLRKIRFH